MKIDVPAFLEALTGMVDCDSGYGAQRPKSVEARSFLLGRYGEGVCSARHALAYPLAAKNHHQALAEFASDLREVASTLEDAIDQMEAAECAS